MVVVVAVVVVVVVVVSSRGTRHKPLWLPSLCTSERVSGEANFEKRRKTRHKPRREKISVPLSASRGKLILRKGVKQDISLGERY